MRAALLAIMVLRHLRLWLLLLLRLLWLLWLRPGTTPLGATTRAVEPIGPTLGAATIRAARTTLATRIKVCAKSIGRAHTRRQLLPRRRPVQPLLSASSPPTRLPA